jgi:hypothetical protein
MSTRLRADKIKDMGTSCSCCQASLRAQARYCSICGSPRLPASNIDERGYQSVLQESSYLAPEWQAAMNAALAQRHASLAPPRRLGKPCEPLLVMVLPFLTFGLYAIYWWWRAGREIRTFLDGREPAPIRDLALLILTGGVWRFVMHYNYAARIADMQERCQLPRSDYLKFLCPLLSFCWLGFVSLALMQRELNKIWETHGYGQG